MPVFKIDFHHHCKGDPVDHLSYTANDLTDQLCKKGIHAYALTPHGSVFHDPEAIAHARTRGILLIPGVEKMIEGREVLLLNVTPEEIPREMTFTDLQALREKKGDQLLVIAPHPFYPMANCAGPVLTEHAALFDAVEFAHFYGLGINPNRRAVRWAEAHGKAVVANSDSHFLEMAGRNHSEVECPELSWPAIVHAVRERKTRVISRPLTILEILEFLMRVAGYQALRRFLVSR